MKDPGSGDRRGILRLIAVFKLLKVALLVAVGIGIFRLHGRDLSHEVSRWIADTGLNLSGPSADRIFQRLQFFDTRKLQQLGVASLTYAVLFAIEGIGLWQGKRWGEYLTLFITGSFLPFELYELAKEPSVLKGVTVVLNAAIEVYLIVRVVRSRRPKEPPTRRAPGGARLARQAS